MRKIFLVSTGIGLALAGSSTAVAQYAEDALRFSQFGLGVSARSLGMGNATIGVANDFSALFTNPAGLAQQRSYEFSIGLSGFDYGDNATFFGNQMKSDNSSTTLNNLGVVYPIPTSRGALTFAFGFGRIADYTTGVSFSGFNPTSSIVSSMTPTTNLNSLSYADQQNVFDNNMPYQLFLADFDSVSGKLVPLVRDSVQQSATVLESGGVNYYSFGGAMDISRSLSIGVGLNIVSGSYSYDRQYAETDPLNVHNVYIPGVTTDLNQFSYESTIKSNLNGFNALFGILYRKQGLMKLGLTVRTPTVYSISEDFTDAGTSSFDNGDTYSISYPGTTSYRIITPYVLSGGASFQVFDWLMLAGDAEYTDWTQLQFDSDNPDLVDENREIKQIFRATTNLRGGAEITLWDLGLQLRGGLIWNPSPYQADANTHDYDQLYYTAGAGIMLEQSTTLNIAYERGAWKTFRDNYYIDNLVSASTTSEKILTNNFNATLSYRF
ncbi:MAG TPA: outer membrane protein transport protein [Bacteroidota bacterium]|nr:outer membrane protein transport protein [Bacteroidota bacterium]